MKILVFLGLALGLGLGTSAFAAPNLEPQFNTATGNVRISNTGADAAGISWATVNCSAQGGGSCPDPAPAAAAPYENPAFPNRASIQIPALGPGQQHNHVIAFFNSLVFAPGTYVFTVCADAGRDVREDNEGDNCARFVKRVRGRPTGPSGLTSNSPSN
jgi:hypothetical protein